MTVSTLRPASSASTASSWPGRKSSKPKISFRISCFELRLAPSRFIKLVPELGSRLRGLPPEPEGLQGGNHIARDEPHCSNWLGLCRGNGYQQRCQQPASVTRETLPRRGLKGQYVVKYLVKYLLTTWSWG